MQQLAYFWIYKKRIFVRFCKGCMPCHRPQTCHGIHCGSPDLPLYKWQCSSSQYAITLHTQLSQLCSRSLNSELPAHLHATYVGMQILVIVRISWTMNY